VLCHLWSNTKADTSCQEWTEVNDIKYLFRISQKWTRQQVHEFLDTAWSYVGIR
jgi:hypothetical protein